MENAQEAIEEYEQRTNSIRRLDAIKDENKCVTMVLDFKYEDHACCYLAQRLDGKQRWVKDPDMEIWGRLIDKYWNSSQSNSDNDEP